MREQARSGGVGVATLRRSPWTCPSSCPVFAPMRPDHADPRGGADPQRSRAAGGLADQSCRGADAVALRVAPDAVANNCTDGSAAPLRAFRHPAVTLDLRITGCPPVGEDRPKPDAGRRSAGRPSHAGTRGSGGVAAGADRHADRLSRPQPAGRPPPPTSKRPCRGCAPLWKPQCGRKRPTGARLGRGGLIRQIDDAGRLLASAPPDGSLRGRWTIIRANLGC